MSETQVFTLEEDEELRFSFPEKKDENIEIELNSGTAEIFGFELKKDVKYPLHSSCGSFSVFTFQGCKLSISGKLTNTPKKNKENPMIMYLQIHAALEQMRRNAEKAKEEESSRGKRAFW